MLFRLDSVTKTYGRVTALRNLSVEVGPGAVGLLGPNGAGKTTLIRTLLGLIDINAGGGAVLGMDIRRQFLDIRQVVGFVPERDQMLHRLFGTRPVRNGDARDPRIERKQRIDDDEGLPLRRQPLQLVARRFGQDQYGPVGQALRHPVEEGDLARAFVLRR